LLVRREIAPTNLSQHRDWRDPLRALRGMLGKPVAAFLVKEVVRAQSEQMGTWPRCAMAWRPEPL
jgi:hypothetical protein